MATPFAFCSPSPDSETFEPPLKRQSTVEDVEKYAQSLQGHADQVDDSSDHPDLKHIKGLNHQFNMLVTISTFTVGFIVAFISLIQSLSDPQKDKPSTAFSVGMLFSFLGLLSHLGNTLIAGRAVAVTANLLALQSIQDSPGLSYFSRYLLVCEQLQLFGGIFFSVSLTIMVFLIFDAIKYPIVLVVYSGLASVLVFVGIYWKISISYKSFKGIRRWLGIKGTTEPQRRATV